MRACTLALAGLFFQVASAATDTDTVCAAVFTLLSENARANGSGTGAFDAGVDRAQRAHLAFNPSEDPQRYALVVIDGAQAIREGLSRGAIDFETVANTVASCQDRYFAQNTTPP